MDSKHIECPCCGKEVEIPIGEYGVGFDFNYSILINSIEEFFDLVDVCPECGYAMLFDNEITDEIIEYIKSDEYRTIYENNNLEPGFKNWILLAMILEEDENYTEAGIAYCKAYDYLEIKGFPLDKRIIEKSASCFLSAAEEYISFIDAFLAIDAMRRDGDFESAKHFLETTCETFEGELVENLAWEEEMWIDLKDTSKKYWDI